MLNLEETIAVTQNFCNSANLLHVCDDMKSPHDADADYLAFKRAMRTVRPDVHERLVEVGAAYAVGLVRRTGPSACTVGLVRRTGPSACTVGMHRRPGPSASSVGMHRRPGPSACTVGLVRRHIL